MEESISETWGKKAKLPEEKSLKSILVCYINSSTKKVTQQVSCLPYKYSENWWNLIFKVNRGLK